MSAAAAPETNLISALSKLQLNTLPGDLYTRRQLNDLRFSIQLLDLAIKRYDKLFNYTIYAQNRIGKLVGEVDALSSSGVASNNERIASKIRNIQEAAATMATTKNILDSNNISAKKLTMDTFITTLTELSQAIRKVNLDMMKIKADVLFKKEGIMNNSPEDQQENFRKTLSAVELSINSEKRKFVKLKDELAAAENAAKAGESAAKLKARLNRLRGDFNSASSLPIAGLSNPQQRNKVGNIIKKIQTKINTTTKGGKRVTHKRRHTKRRHTRRN
jgi:hypothetical protein